MQLAKDKTFFIQHKVRQEVKEWIEQEAKVIDRSQTWFVNKLVEDAYARAKPATLNSVNATKGAAA